MARCSINCSQLCNCVGLSLKCATVFAIVQLYELLYNCLCTGTLQLCLMPIAANCATTYASLSCNCAGTGTVQLCLMPPLLDPTDLPRATLLTDPSISGLLDAASRRIPNIRILGCSLKKDSNRAQHIRNNQKKRPKQSARLLKVI